MLFKESISDIQASEKLTNLSLVVEDGVIYNSDIENRLYITFSGTDLIITDQLTEIEKEHKIAVDKDSAEFYRRFGFIAPPFTLYKGVYVLAPYVGISLIPPFSCVTRYPEVGMNDNDKINIRYDIQEDIKNSLNKVAGSFRVLFSGGLDSSLLLAVAHEMGKIEVALNCFMSSMPEESIRAEKMCRSKNITFHKEQICGDLTEIARMFIDLTREPVADKIALVIPAMLSKSNAKKSTTILDGQGADSLFQGFRKISYTICTAKRLADIWEYCWDGCPYGKKKNTTLGRNLYRVTKVLHCLKAPGPVSMFIRSLVENEASKLSAGNRVQKWVNKELHSLHDGLGDFHLVIRYFFMFRVLPSREMQKYAISQSLGYVFKLPFLEKEMINKYFYVPPSFSINERAYKYPIVIAAKKYWTGYFSSSRTSPFQVEFDTSGKSVSEFSLSYISDFK